MRQNPLKHPSIIRFFSIWLILFLMIIHIISARAERLPIKIFTSADGLGSSFINYLMRDSRGFMWFCTRDGLSRFDGSHFTTYQIGDTFSPPGIEVIYQSRNGDYWITTTGGLYRFKSDAVSKPDTTNGDKPTLKR
jgi:ligand-binding sensor domain-containing protein